MMEVIKMDNFRQNDANQTPSLMWELFEKTGETGYYMLYKKLSAEDEMTHGK